MSVQENARKKKRGGGGTGSSAEFEGMPEELTTEEDAEEMLASIDSSIKGADELLHKLQRYMPPPRRTCGCG